MHQFWYWYCLKKYHILLFHSLKVFSDTKHYEDFIKGIAQDPKHDYSQQHLETDNAIKYCKNTIKILYHFIGTETGTVVFCS